MTKFNAGRQKLKLFKVGDTVWYLRPPQTGTKLDARGFGPRKIVAKTGENSYDIQVKPERRMAAHATFVKLHVPDKFMGTSVSRYFHQRTRVDTKEIPPQ